MNLQHMVLQASVVLSIFFILLLLKETHPLQRVSIHRLNATSFLIFILIETPEDYDIRTTCKVTLEEIYNGLPVRVNYKENRECLTCHG